MLCLSQPFVFREILGFSTKHRSNEISFTKEKSKLDLKNLISLCLLMVNAVRGSFYDLKSNSVICVVCIDGSNDNRSFGRRCLRFPQNDRFLVASFPNDVRNSDEETSIGNRYRL